MSDSQFLESNVVLACKGSCEVVKVSGIAMSLSCMLGFNNWDIGLTKMRANEVHVAAEAIDESFYNSIVKDLD